MEGVHTDTEVEGILAAVLHQVLVGTDAAGLERLRRDLLPLVGAHVYAQRKLVYLRLLSSEVKDANLWI